MARKSTKTAPAGKNRVKVDFTGVETRVLLPEGVYNAKVEEVTLEPNDGKPYLKWKFLTIDDDSKLNDKPLYNNTSLQPQSLWVLGSLLDTLGVERPDGAMDIDLTELVGLELGLVVEHEDYQGKARAKVVDFTPATDDSEGDVMVDNSEGGETYTTEAVNEMDAEELDAVVTDNDLDVKKSKKIAVYRAAVLAALEEAGQIDDEAGDADGGDADGGDLTEDDILAMDADELDALVEEHGLEVKKSKKLPVYAAAVAEAMEEAGLLGSTEGGDDEKYTEDAINEMDADELGEVIEKHSLDVKVDKKLSKYRAAVLAALEAEDLIEEESDLYTEDAINEMDDDELKEVIEKHDLDVTLTKKVAKNRSLVIDALEAAELMADE
jgi:hypothetical protein